MIKHIVMWKFKDFAEGRDKITNIQMSKEKLLSLKNKINAIGHIEVGVNINDSASAYDMVLYSEFQDLYSLKEYQNHPEHLIVSEFIGKVRDVRIVTDYEI